MLWRGTVALGLWRSTHQMTGEMGAWQGVAYLSMCIRVCVHACVHCTSGVYMRACMTVCAMRGHMWTYAHACACHCMYPHACMGIHASMCMCAWVQMRPALVHLLCCSVPCCPSSFASPACPASLDPHHAICTPSEALPPWSDASRMQLRCSRCWMRRRDPTVSWWTRRVGMWPFCGCGACHVAALPIAGCCQKQLLLLHVSCVLSRCVCVLLHLVRFLSSSAFLLSPCRSRFVAAHLTVALH